MYHISCSHQRLQAASPAAGDQREDGRDRLKNVQNARTMASASTDVVATTSLVLAFTNTCVFAT